MSELIIHAENVSKVYRTGRLGSGSLRHDFDEFWRRTILKKKELPDILNIQESPARGDYFWALKNVNLEIRQGETWGIVGKNGSGKSTLLKILSRIVKPTEGRIRGRGKVSSLLEVGTGFHPDLTGRENIFISGHMLGMNKAEIYSKFDEIVNFSGVDLYLDTPVKRYSSGMYVRLAFAVAAHLEPDILIVDEVLAVGDAEFQRKCLGKMNEVSGRDGRTVIFVSHNMQAVNNLCVKSLWLENGEVKKVGDTKAVVNYYLGNMQKKNWSVSYPVPENAPGNDRVRVLSFELIPQLISPLAPIDIRTPLVIRYKLFNYIENIDLCIGLHLFTLNGECVFDVSHRPGIYRKGYLEGECSIPGNFLNDGGYYFSLIVVKDTSEVVFYFENALRFEVEDYREHINWYGKWMGIVRPNFPVTLRQSTEKYYTAREINSVK